jgi:hypothetical protein
MSKNQRVRQRALRAERRREEKLDTIKQFGVSDPVPREAVDKIIKGKSAVGRGVLLE